MLKILAFNSNFVSNVKLMENNSHHPLLLNIIMWVTGFTYSMFSTLTAEKFSTFFDLAIKVLTIISVLYVIRWHRLQIARAKKQDNDQEAKKR